MCVFVLKQAVTGSGIGRTYVHCFNKNLVSRIKNKIIRMIHFNIPFSTDIDFYMEH